MKKNKLAIFVALALHQISGSAYAQADQTAATDENLQEVKVTARRELPASYNLTNASTGTKIDAPLRDVPQTVNVVPQQVLRDQSVQSMESALKSVPGIGLSNGDGQRDQVTIRGFSAIADQFVDGFRDDALYFRDLSNIERIEVLKGPASVLYGRGSSGGLINRVSKMPGINKSEIAATVGSWNQRRGEFDLARDYSDSGVAFRITGAVEKADSYRDQQFLDRKVISPSVLFKLGSGTTLLLQAEHLSDRRVTDFGIPSFEGRPVDVRAGTYYGAANARDVDYTHSEVSAYGATFNHRFNDGLSLRSAFRYYDYSSDRNNTLIKSVGGVNEAAQTATLNHFSFGREDDGKFNQTELVQKMHFAGMHHHLLYGIELGKQNKGQALTPAVDVGTVNLFNPVLPVVARTRAGRPTTLSDFTTSAAYVQDLVTLSDHWKALAGVRFDKFKQETRAPGARTLQRTDREWSPRVGVVYQPASDQSYYGSFTKSFQPSAENFPLAANNEQLAPEETTNKEIGAKFDFFGNRASGTVSLFQLERTNIKSADPANRGKIIPIGTQRTNGLELTFTGELAQGWQIWSGYAYLDAKITSSTNFDTFENRPAVRGSQGVSIQGKRATLTPAHSANLWLTKALGSHYRAGAGVNYVDDRFANAGNTVTLPGYAVVDAMLAYKIANFDLQLNVNNLFDRRYVSSGHGVVPNLNTPGAPRNYRLTARYNF